MNKTLMKRRYTTVVDRTAPETDSIAIFQAGDVCGRYEPAKEIPNHTEKRDIWIYNGSFLFPKGIQNEVYFFDEDLFDE